MKIVVCIKQVPDTSNIKWTKNNTIDRESVDSILNPYDESALEFALKLKDNNKSISVTAITMGPLMAEDILKKALAVGLDDAFLISDKKFAGSDTYVTSKILSKAIKLKIPDYNLIICGQYAIDGDTGQTGPGIAQMLNIPSITYVKNILCLNNDSIICTKENENSDTVIKMDLKGLICTLKTDHPLRKAKVSGYIKAQNYNIEKLGLNELGLFENEVGIIGSPTYVSQAYRYTKDINCEFLSFKNISNSAQYILNEVLKIKSNK